MHGVPSNVMTDPRKLAIANELARARQFNLDLLSQVPEELSNRVLHPDFRPLRWHMGHVGMFESWMILEQAKGGQPPDKELARIYSTEYPRSELHDLPPMETALSFSAAVRDEVLAYLDTVDLDAEHQLTRNGYIFHNVITHEYQHTETIAYLLQHASLEFEQQPQIENSASPYAPEAVMIPGGEYAVGRQLEEPLFSYDNEWPRHKVKLTDFLLNDSPSTNSDFLEFLSAGGYERKELWSDAGWRWRNETEADKPFYWRPEGNGDWIQKTITGSIPLPLSHPVTLISFHEAQAFANFNGMRLPTEAEWEVAASWDPQQGRQLLYPWGDRNPPPADARHGQPLGWTEPAGKRRNRSPLGLYDMIGNIWEWTSTPFDGYPGFKPFPYPGYSEVWFDGLHQVVRGGCFVTGAPMLRATFRNWFYPRTRERFIGVRLARDA